MRAFVRLKQTIASSKELLHKLNDLESKVSNHDFEIQKIFEVIRQLMAEPEKPKRRIGFHLNQKLEMQGRKSRN